MSSLVQSHAYIGSDTKETFRSRRTLPDGTQGYLRWSDYDEISIIVRQAPTGTTAQKAASVGPLVSVVSSVVDIALFEIEGQNDELLVVNVSKLPNLVPFTDYELTLKVHDADHPDGQVIADPKANNNLPTLWLRAWPGDDN